MRLALAVAILAACSPTAETSHPVPFAPILLQPEPESERYIVVHSTSPFEFDLVDMGDGDLDRMAREPGVMWIEQDTTAYAVAVQTDPPWGLDRIDKVELPLDSEYSYITTGAGVHVYVIDSGIRATHNEFTGRVGAGTGFIPSGPYEPGDTIDCSGHGTHVSGIVAGATYGVAKGAIIHPAKVLTCCGSGPTSGVLSALTWVRDNHESPAVVNMSIGWGAVIPSVDAAIADLRAMGVVVVAAAGNRGTDACNYSPGSSTGDSIVVGGLLATDERFAASNLGECVDLFAPGFAITSAYWDGDDAVRTLSGTSMASPHVAGAVARYLEAHPTATPTEVETAFVDGASHGVINPGAGSPDAMLYAGICL